MDVELEQPLQDDPVSLLSAASRLRHGQRPAARREERVRIAASRLLESVAAAAARDRTSVPVAVRRAATALAAEATRQEPRACDAGSPAGPRPARSRTPPFTASIRLGRMG